jgi:hypothetical protein
MAERDGVPRHVLELAGWPPSVNRRYHPVQRYRLARPFAEAVAWQAKALQLPRPYARARVTVVWQYWRTCDVQDPDNAVARATPLLNALKGIALVDDDPDHLDLVVRQEKIRVPADRKNHVRLEIEQLEVPDDR